MLDSHARWQHTGTSWLELIEHMNKVKKPTNIHANIHSYIHTHIHTYIRTHIHTYTHTYTNTHNICNACIQTQTGASIPPEAMMQFPLCFRFPPISEKKIRTHGKFSKFYLFPKNSRFSSAKISDDLFSHWLTHFHLFSLFQEIPPILGKLLFPPYTLKITTSGPNV